MDADFEMVEYKDAVDGHGSGDILASVSSRIDKMSGDLRDISLTIHDNPELQFEEFHAHRILTQYLGNQKGWSVTPSAYGLQTAFVAVYCSHKKGPVVSFNAEYDALAGIGHACGHNLIATTSLAAALATADVLESEKLPGKVVLFGTPAEEGGGGKIKLLNSDAYKEHEVDMSLITHPGISPNHALVRTAAYSSFNVEYFGKESHAAARPLDGESQITNGGLRPNIIHAYSSGRFVVRSTTRPRLESLKKRVFACFDAGSTATGATLKLTEKMSYDAHIPNRTLGRSYRHFFNRLVADDHDQLGGKIAIEEVDWIKGQTQASTDQGNVSYAMPSISPSVWIRSEDEGGKQLGGPHTPDFEKAARSEESHMLALRAAKALAATAVDFLTRPELINEAKKEFEKLRR